MGKEEGGDGEGREEEGKAYSQIITVRPHNRRKKPNLLDPMPLPYPEGVVLEAGEEIGEAAGEGGVDAEFDDHGGWLDRFEVGCKIIESKI